jgi:hypothetical protein
MKIRYYEAQDISFQKKLKRDYRDCCLVSLCDKGGWYLSKDLKGKSELALGFQ